MNNISFTFLKKKITHAGVDLLSFGLGAQTQPPRPRHAVSFYKTLYFFSKLFFIKIHYK